MILLTVPLLPALGVVVQTGSPLGVVILGVIPITPFPTMCVIPAGYRLMTKHAGFPPEPAVCRPQREAGGALEQSR